MAARAGYGFKKNEGKNTRYRCTQRLKKRSIFGLNALTWLQNRVLLFFLPSARIEKRLNSRRLDRRSVLKLVEKRARTSGILKRVCCHSFRATGVTEYMNSGGTIEIAPRFLIGKLLEVRGPLRAKYGLTRSARPLTLLSNSAEVTCLIFSRSLACAMPRKSAPIGEGPFQKSTKGII